MAERSGDVLDDLTFEEMDAWVATEPETIHPRRRFPPAADGIKLTPTEVRQALEGMPQDISAEKAKEERIKRLDEAIIAKREMALVEAFVQKALGPEPTKEQREAIGAALGHMYRLGGMFMRTHQAVPMYTPVVKALAAAEARKKRWDTEEQRRREDIIDTMLATYNKKRGMAPLAHEINEELERQGLKPKKPVSEGHLYKRLGTLRLTDQPKSDSSSG